MRLVISRRAPNAEGFNKEDTRAKRWCAKEKRKRKEKNRRSDDRKSQPREEDPDRKTPRGGFYRFNISLFQDWPSVR